MKGKGKVPPETVSAKRMLREEKEMLKALRVAIREVRRDESGSPQVRRAKIIRALRAKRLPTSFIPPSGREGK